MLTEQRTAIKAALEAGADKPAGFKAFEYMGEVLAPPCAAIVPAEPYLRGPDRAEGIPFGRMFLGIDVLLISAREDAKAAARATDELIEYAVGELQPFGVKRVSRPGVVTISGAKYIGSVVTIEQLTERP